MRCLVVHAHPLPKSLTRHFCDVARKALADRGHAVTFLDLYQAGFDPRLREDERETHYAPAPNLSHVEQEVAQLRDAEMIVLVFPTWWFGLPAMLKGWIDRVFAPTVAFEQTPDFGPLKPLLTGLRKVVAITTLGSPWWMDRLVLWRPVRRQLKWAVFKTCAPAASFEILSFYGADNPGAARVEAFARTISSRLSRI
jgi:NAD(P)H dehydrogenase (quinone)